MFWTPPPGSIGLTHAYGYTAFIGTFAEMAAGQSARRYTHAFIVVDDETAIEPWPSGARLVDLDDFDSDPVAYVWLPHLTEQKRRRVVQAAVGLDGTPYRARDLWSVTASRWVRHGRHARRVCSAGRLPPGRFVAETYRRAGVPLFGGRSDVTVGDLASLIVAVDGWDQRVVFQ